MRGVAEAAKAEAAAASSHVESSVAMLVVQTEVATSRAFGVLPECVEKAAAETEAKASCTVGSMVQ